jgi:DNA polymerase-1
MNKVLCIDGFNFLHRARAGFNLGDYPVVFNFFRNLRALVELHNPSRVYFVLEGHPQKRYELLPEYKANRDIIVPTEGPVPPEVTKKVAELESFFRQSRLIIDLLSRHFPVSVVRHADYECDDVIFNLVRRSSNAVPWVVASNDSDFTQLLNEFPHVKLYNPIAKEYVATPPFDYVTWKALRGDGSDNIPGLPGIGDKTAEELINDPERLGELFKDKDMAEQFSRNYTLIRFHTWSDEDAMKMTCSTPTKDWDAVVAKFEEWQFKSLLKDKSWDKFLVTFNFLWGTENAG